MHTHTNTYTHTYRERYLYIPLGAINSGFPNTLSKKVVSPLSALTSFKKLVVNQYPECSASRERERERGGGRVTDRVSI